MDRPPARKSSLRRSPSTSGRTHAPATTTQTKTQPLRRLRVHLSHDRTRILTILATPLPCTMHALERHVRSALWMYNLGDVNGQLAISYEESESGDVRVLKTDEDVRIWAGMTHSCGAGEEVEPLNVLGARGGSARSARRSLSRPRRESRDFPLPFLPDLDLDSDDTSSSSAPAAPPQPPSLSPRTRALQRSVSLPSHRHVIDTQLASTVKRSFTPNMLISTPSYNMHQAHSHAETEAEEQEQEPQIPLTPPPPYIQTEEFHPPTRIHSLSRHHVHSRSSPSPTHPTPTPSPPPPTIVRHGTADLTAPLPPRRYFVRHHHQPSEPRGRLLDRSRTFPHRARSPTPPPAYSSPPSITIGADDYISVRLPHTRSRAVVSLRWKNVVRHSAGEIAGAISLAQRSTSTSRSLGYKMVTRPEDFPFMCMVYVPRLSSLRTVAVQPPGPMLRLTIFFNSHTLLDLASSLFPLKITSLSPDAFVHHFVNPLRTDLSDPPPEWTCIAPPELPHEYGQVQEETIDVGFIVREYRHPLNEQCRSAVEAWIRKLAICGKGGWARTLKPSEARNEGATLFFSQMAEAGRGIPQIFRR
ncbi:hypothetical protein M427DRAFT_70378 [Gonapodya prolifera JEL478]|uniref:Uncharacterized protein n=1 Tax=Gonapodya prolifera (strain JEL478) TaxID=1344416 RepID=A0A139ADB4_GONPJ|nr:hypothetical protein M427DRAFT_70378 [Gonapodya prolifera JEL478]|eukprot:KXS14816.1 hypothetical protein M427DRAFT_70378 [Gonapodya prolifera JEL478]